MARLHRGHLAGVLACVSLVTAMLGGAAASAATLPTTQECAAPGADPPPPSFSQWPQVVLIAFENKDPNYVLPGGAHDGQGVLGNPKAKYFTQLAADCGRVVNYHAIGYPSLPNYIAQTAGMIPPYIASKGGGLGRDCRWTPGQAVEQVPRHLRRLAGPVPPAGRDGLAERAGLDDGELRARRRRQRAVRPAPQPGDVFRRPERRLGRRGTDVAGLPGRQRWG